MAWLTGWGYRKSHVVNSASGAGTGYQVKITAHYGSGTDSGGDVYLNSHSRTDFGDVRFTKSDGTTLLNYWMESKTDSDNAVFWVKIEDDLSSAAKTIYVYYGNPSATDASNGDATFLFFDHFSGTSLDTNKWGIIRQDSQISYSVSNSIFSMACNSAQSVWYGMMVRSTSAFGSGTAIEAYVQPYYDGTYPNSNRYVGFIDNSGLFDNVISGTTTASNYVKALYQVGAWNPSPYYQGSLTNRASGTESASNFSISMNTYRRLTITWTSSITRVFENATQKTSLTTNIPTVSQYAGVMFERGANSGGACIYVDWIAVRKYVDPEPSQGSWGSEETPAVAYTVTLTESLGLTDSAVKAPSVAKSELLGLSDAVSAVRLYAQTLTELLGLSDVVAKAPSVVRAESLGLLDSYSRLWGAHQTYSENLGLADCVQKSPSAIKSERLGLSDAVQKSPSLLKSELLGLSDAYSRTWSACRTCTEPLGLSDVLRKAPGKAFSEALGLSDTYSRVFTAYRTFTEPLGLNDTVSKGVALHALVEALSLYDSISYGKNITALAKLIRKYMQLVNLGGD